MLQETEKEEKLSSHYGFHAPKRKAEPTQSGHSQKYVSDSSHVPHCVQRNTGYKGSEAITQSVATLDLQRPDIFKALSKQILQIPLSK